VEEFFGRSFDYSFMLKADLFIKAAAVRVKAKIDNFPVSWTSDFHYARKWASEKKSVLIRSDPSQFWHVFDLVGT
jgi:hypothetical protein